MRGRGGVGVQRGARGEDNRSASGVYTKSWIPAGGGMATLERVDAEAIQTTGIQRGGTATLERAGAAEKRAGGGGEAGGAGGRGGGGGRGRGADGSNQRTLTRGLKIMAFMFLFYVILQKY